MLSNIRASQYQYIFLSPEQLASNNIRDIIRFCKNRISIVGIDKLYLVYKQGDEFRPKYAELKSARKLLRLDTVLIRASATLSDETLQKVKALASFCLEAEKLFYLTVIRSSIDRLDTIYILKNIPSKVLRESWLILYQLLKYIVDASSYAIPQNIDKALCFIDSYSSVNKSVQRFRWQLVNITKDVVDTTKKYTINSANGSYNVCNIVSFYTSYIANADQDKRYAEFKKLSTASIIRILFGTLAVAIGTNFPNIKYIIQLRNTITKDINNIIQRLGRAGRSLLAGKQAYTVLYLLQYLDNRERNVPANSNYQSMVPRTSTDYNTISDYLPSNIVVRALARLNRLRYVETLGNKFDSDRNGVIDLEEQFEDNVKAAIDSLNLIKKRDQTKAQIAARNNSPKIIRKLQYTTYYLVRTKKICFRTVLYKQYSEALLRYLAQRIVLGIADCCS